MRILYKFKSIFRKVITLGSRKASSLYDYILFILGIRYPVKFSYDPDKHLVIYLGENLPPRIARMVKWLKKTPALQSGKEALTAILVCSKDGFHKKFSNDFFDEVLLFRNEWHLYRILKNFRNKKALIHSFGPKTFYPDKARIFMKQNKFLYDMQDVLCIYYGMDTRIRWFRQEFPHEKNVLSLSDGLVSHGLEPLPATKLYGIKKRPPLLFFPLYCDNDSFQDNTKELRPDDIHLVYAGEIMGSFRDKKQFGNVQFHRLIDELSRQRIHFHVYPSPSTLPLYFEEYRQVEKQNPFFHLHKAVAQDELAKELSKYHFGIIPFFKANTGQSDDKYKYSTALKLFNFMEAGIPVLVSEDIEFQCRFALRYKAGIGIKKEDISALRNIIEKTDYRSMVNGLLVEREKISLKRNIRHLVDFYRRY